MKHVSARKLAWHLVELFAFLLLTNTPTLGQIPAWQTALVTHSGPNLYAPIRATATDANGNVYLTGNFQGTVVFGSTTLTSTTATAPDIYIAKWNPVTATFMWALRAGGTGTDEGTALAVNGNSVYVTGTYTGTTATFGITNLLNTSSYTTYSDIFVARISDAGTTAGFVWAISAGGIGVDIATALAVNAGSLYVAGNFSGAGILFDTLVANGAGRRTAFVARLQDVGSTGVFNWVQSAGGGSYSDNFAQGLAVSGNNVYVCGSYNGLTITIGNTTLPNYGIGGSNIFIAKLTDTSTSGDFVWALRAGGTGANSLGLESGYALAIKGSNVYMAGAFDSPTATFGNTLLSNAGGSGINNTNDIYVAKITDTGPTGSFVWAQRAGGRGDDMALGVALAGTDVLVTGAYNVTADFGSTSLVSAGLYDIFVTKIADMGTTSRFVWAQGAGGSGYDYGYAVSLVGTKLYVAGTFGSATVAFGAITLNSPNISGGFLASLTDPTLTATTAAQGSLSFSLAPNPARTATTVTLPAIPGAATATLILRDALGRAVRTTTVPLPPAGLRHELDLSGLAPGLYAVQVRAGSTSGTRRLVVE